jgi:exportin-1
MSEAQRLLDFSQPCDVALLEATVGFFYGAGTEEQVQGAGGCVGRLPAALAPHAARTPLASRAAKPGAPPPPVQRKQAESILKAFQDNPEAWTRVDSILEHAKSEQTKFFGLQVRRGPQARRWALPLGRRGRCRPSSGSGAAQWAVIVPGR